MIVETMSLPELRKEIEKDLAVAQRKVNYHWDIVRKMMRKTNMKAFIKYYTYFSPNKNNWIYGIRGFDYGTNHKYYMVVYYYTKEGITAVQITSSGALNVFSGHFFERYYGRLKMDVKVPTQWIIKFMETIRHYTDIKHKEISAGYYETMACIETGACLGYYDTVSNIYIYKTFIREDMLMGDQVEKYAMLKKQWNELFSQHQST